MVNVGSSGLAKFRQNRQWFITDALVNLIPAAMSDNGLPGQVRLGVLAALRVVNGVEIGLFSTLRRQIGPRSDEQTDLYAAVNLRRSAASIV